VTSLQELGLFDRVYWPKGSHASERYHGIGRFTEWYFDVGQKRFNVMENRCGEVISLEPAQKKRATCGRLIAKVITCFLKILTYMTIVIPLVMFVAKLIYRSSNNFEIFRNNIPPIGDNSNIEKNSVIEQKRLNLPAAKRPAATPSKKPNSNRTALNKNKQVVQRYVNADFSEDIIADRIDRFTKKMERIEIVDQKGLATLHQLYVDMVSQDLNLRLILEHHGNYLEQIQVDYITKARAEIDTQIKLLSENVKNNNNVYIVFKRIEASLKNSLDLFDEDTSRKIADETFDQYLTFANLLDKLEITDEDPNNKAYDRKIYERVSLLLKPMPLKNYGNTCYLNSALQAILATPFFKERIRAERWTPQILTHNPEETNNEYAARSNKHQSDFNKQTRDWRNLHKQFQSLATALEKRDQSALNSAVNNLNRAFGKARCFDGAMGRQHDAIQPIETLLMAIDYAFETTKRIRYTPDGLDPVEKIKICLPEKDRSIRLMIKEYLNDAPYATSFQSLIEHQFAEKTYTENTTVDGEAVTVRHELTKLQKIEDYLVVNLVRPGESRQRTKGRVIAGKHQEDIKFTNGEIIDFTSAYDPSLIADNKRILYEVKAVAIHHGQSYSGGHWTANVKRGGKWYICNDSSPVISIGICNPFIGSGSIYFFKRKK